MIIEKEVLLNTYGGKSTLNNCIQLIKQIVKFVKEYYKKKGKF